MLYFTLGFISQSVFVISNKLFTLMKRGYWRPWVLFFINWLRINVVVNPFWMNFNVKYILPTSIRGVLKKLIWAYTDYFSFKSYSGEGEYVILRNILYKKGKGFYVNIGAYHPKKTGINIDAVPGSMKLFNRLRKY